MSRRIGLLLWLLVGFLVFLPEAWAENWKVVWKDSVQELRLDQDSIQVNGAVVEYWYSDQVDALVDWMEHRYHVLSDCQSNQMKHLEVYEPPSGPVKPVEVSEWKDIPYESNDPVAVMHYEICSDYVGPL